MKDQVTKVFEHREFAIWHVPQANGYVYEAAGIVIDGDNYEDCPFESTYDDALNAACELYDVEVGTISAPLPVVYSNTLFRVYKTPGQSHRPSITPTKTSFPFMRLQTPLFTAPYFV